jgi:hypothetical protein
MSEEADRVGTREVEVQAARARREHEHANWAHIRTRPDSGLGLSHLFQAKFLETFKVFPSRKASPLKLSLS